MAVIGGFRSDHLGNLRTRVFEKRTVTGSELSILTCPHTTTFTMLSIFSPLEMSSIKIWETIRSQHEKCFLPDGVRVARLTEVLETFPRVFCLSTKTVVRTSNLQGATIRPIVSRHKHSIVFIVDH